MPSDSVESFLDKARENRLLPTEQVYELVRQSEVPQANVPALCDALVSRGLLTRFQANRIREGRVHELAFAGYPIIDDLGPCPGGFALKATHPSLRTPIVLRRISTDWLTPADNLSAYIQRAQQVSTVIHPYLATLLEAGAYEDQLFVVLEPTDGAHLEELVRDIGPMPEFLACRSMYQAALALEAAHKAGHIHGDVRPGVIFLHPLQPSSRKRPDGSTIHRPAPDAAVKVAELGLVPRRPALLDWFVNRPASWQDWAYLPPERLTSGSTTTAGDVFGLGQTLVYLLTGQPPLTANNHQELLDMIGRAQPRPLAALRPDLSAGLIDLVKHMIDRDPACRPTMSTVAERLKSLQESPAPIPLTPQRPIEHHSPERIAGHEPPVNLQPIHNVDPRVNPTTPVELQAQPIELAPAATPTEWTIQPYEGSVGDGEHMLAPAAEEHHVPQSFSHDEPLHGFNMPSTPVARRRQMTNEEVRKQKKQWGIIAGGLWLLSIPLWIILLNTYGCFDSKKSAEPGKPVKTRR